MTRDEALTMLKLPPGTPPAEVLAKIRKGLEIVRERMAAGPSSKTRVVLDDTAAKLRAAEAAWTAPTGPTEPPAFNGSNGDRGVGGFEPVATAEFPVMPSAAAVLSVPPSAPPGSPSKAFAPPPPAPVPPGSPSKAFAPPPPAPPDAGKPTTRKSVAIRPPNAPGSTGPIPMGNSSKRIGLPEHMRTPVPPPDGKSYPVVEGFEIFRELGRGGMGVVYMARQTKLNRIVALKMILSGAHADERDLERFRNEADAVARLSHPNIVQVYEVGRHDGLPYLALEYCGGGTLAGRLGGRPQAAKAAAQTVETLARAVAAAHAAGVVHRDIKPENVLITDDGKLKLTDFGLAKRTDSTAATRTGTVMGSISYMAPEQAGDLKKAGASADLYSLGVILYEMLTGRPPFLGENELHVIWQLLSQDPVPVRQLVPRTPVDLETICLKCLAKEPHRRYPDAEALADDLRRFLDSRPILARPIGPVERAIKWARRKPALAALAGVVVAAVVALAVFTWRLDSAYAEAAQQRDRAVSAEESAKSEAKRAADAEAAALRDRDRVAAAEAESRRLAAAAERSLYSALCTLIDRAREEGRLSRVRQLLEDMRPGPGRDDLRGFEWRYAWSWSRSWRAEIRGLPDEIFRAAPTADGRTVLVAGMGDQIRTYDVATGREGAPLSGHVNAVQWVEVSPDGRLAASAGFDGAVKLWDVAARKCVADLKGHGGPVSAAVFSKDGSRLATASVDKTVRIWAVGSPGAAAAVLGPHPGICTAVALSPDGKLAASACDDGVVRLWDAVAAAPAAGEAKAPLAELRGHERPVTGVAFSPDGKLLATCGEDRTVRLWDVAARREAPALLPATWSAVGSDAGTVGAPAAPGTPGAGAAPGRLARALHAAPVNAVAFSPDGRLLASAADDRLVRLWDVAAGREFAVLRGHEAAVRSVAFTADGRSLVSGGKDRAVIVWSAAAGPEGTLALRHERAVTAVAVSPDGSLIATGSHDETVRLWDADGGEVAVLRARKAPVSVLFSPDGRTLYAAAREGFVEVWDLAAPGRPAKPALPGKPEHFVNAVALSPDGTLMATAGLDGAVLTWSAADGRVRGEFRAAGGIVNSVAFSRDGRRLAAGGTDKVVRVWELGDSAAGDRLVAELRGAELPLNSVAFSPDGRRVIGCGGDRTVRVWEIETGRTAAVLRGHEGPVGAVAVSADGRTLAAAGFDRTLRLWDAETGRELATLVGHEGALTALAASPAGPLMVTGGRDRNALVWRGATDRRVLSDAEREARAAPDSPEALNALALSAWSLASGDPAAAVAPDERRRLLRIGLEALHRLEARGAASPLRRAWIERFEAAVGGDGVGP